MESLREEAKRKARLNLALWGMLFSGVAQVRIEEVFRWPLRKVVEMAEARKLWEEQVKQHEEATDSVPWWESGLVMK